MLPPTGYRRVRRSGSAGQHRFDLVQAVLTPEQLIVDEHGRCPEGAAFNRLIGIGLQPVLDSR
jgi:hypothetical protein